MNKTKLFVENFVVYGFGGIISKLIPLIMVPIVARLMPNSIYFGISDMSNTIINFCGSFALMGMYDAMYRMFFDMEEKTHQKKICSTAFLFTILMSFIVSGLMVFFRNWVAYYFFDDIKYSNLVYLTAMATLVGTTNSIISAPTRMQNRRKIFLITNTISPIISYTISVPLLMKGYYIIALPLANLVSGAVMEFSFFVLNRDWFSVRFFDFKLLRSMLKIGIPLMPNFLIYWIFNSCDRLMITRLIGIGEAGVYSIGSKLGLASQLIYTAFAGGWQFFAFSTMKEEDQVKNNSSVFEYLGVLSFICGLCLCVIAQPIYRILFEDEYHRAFIVSPYLFLAPLFQMLFQIAANQFLVIKKTWPNMLFLFAGAMINILANFWLIPMIGIEGAAISTLLGYFVSDVVCVVVLSKINLMILNRRFVVVFLVSVMAFLLWRFCFMYSTLSMLLVTFIYTVCIGVAYREDLVQLFVRLKRKREND